MSSIIRDVPLEEIYRVAGSQSDSDPRSRLSQSSKLSGQRRWTSYPVYQSLNNKTPIAENNLDLAVTQGIGLDTRHVTDSIDQTPRSDQESHGLGVPKEGVLDQRYVHIHLVNRQADFVAA